MPFLIAALVLLAEPLTTQQDHQRVLDLLKIKSLRPGANGRYANASNAANYDETKATPYPTLPNPLLFNIGKQVKSAKAWHNKAAPKSSNTSTAKSMAANPS